MTRHKQCLTFINQRKEKEIQQCKEFFHIRQRLTSSDNNGQKYITSAPTGAKQVRSFWRESWPHIRNHIKAHILNQESHTSCLPTEICTMTSSLLSKNIHHNTCSYNRSDIFRSPIKGLSTHTSLNIINLFQKFFSHKV